MERLMFGWYFEVDAWSRFWRLNLIDICVWPCDMNSILGSVVPLAMFHIVTCSLSFLSMGLRVVPIGGGVKTKVLLSLSADFQTQEGWYQFHFPPEAWTRPVSQTQRSPALGVLVSDELDCHLDLKIIWTIRNLFSMAIPTFRTKQGNKLQSTRTVVEYCSLFGNENVVTPYKKSVSCCTTIAGVCTNWWFLFSKQCNAWPQQRKQSVILSTDQCVNGVDGDYAVEASTCDKVYASVSKMSHPYQLTANMEEIASYIIQK